MFQTTFSPVAFQKDIKSLGALCSSVRWAAKSSVTWLGSPPGNAAHIGQIWNESRESRFTYRWTLIRYLSGWIFYCSFYLDQVLTRQKYSRSWTSVQRGGWTRATGLNVATFHWSRPFVGVRQAILNTEGKPELRHICLHRLAKQLPQESRSVCHAVHVHVQAPTDWQTLRQHLPWSNLDSRANHPTR